MTTPYKDLWSNGFTLKSSDNDTDAVIGPIGVVGAERTHTPPEASKLWKTAAGEEKIIKGMRKLCLCKNSITPHYLNSSLRILASVIRLRRAGR